MMEEKSVLLDSLSTVIIVLPEPRFARWYLPNLGSGGSSYGFQ
jgi:hypothetical protein